MNKYISYFKFISIMIFPSLSYGILVYFLFALSSLPFPLQINAILGCAVLTININLLLDVFRISHSLDLKNNKMGLLIAIVLLYIVYALGIYIGVLVQLHQESP